MKTAIIGCGYVADSYLLTLRGHHKLELVAAHDRDAARRAAFQKHHGVPVFDSLEALLRESSAELVLNLTNPRSHAAVTGACLRQGKHVYSEKPLGMTPAEARDLATLAQDRGLTLSSAPCSVLGETAQTLWKALRDGLIGKVRLVIANFDDGMIAPAQQPWNWQTPSGAAWPAKDEFEIGCTYEHAGYFLTWLAAFFGPARRVTSFAATLLPDKGIPVDHMAPDFTAGCIEYDHDVVARVTCSLVAPHDKSLTIIGDTGVLHTRNLRDDAAPVYLRREPLGGRLGSLERKLNGWQGWLERHVPWIPWAWQEWRFQKQLPFVSPPSSHIPRGSKRVDFCRGPVELAEAVRENRPCRLSAELGVHIVELVEALQHPERSGGARDILSSFPAIAPLP
jgi:predicted dehydrogenase